MERDAVTDHSPSLGRRPAPHSGAADGGFTLIEVLIAISISAVIVSALGVALDVGLRTNGTTLLRLAQSHDAQSSSRYFAADAASATAVTAAATPGCVTGLTGTALVSFTGTVPATAQAAATATTWAASWVLDPGTGTLSRAVCAGGTTPTTTLVVSRNVASVSALTCAPSCSTPRAVSLTVTETADPRNPTGTFSYNLLGSVRANNVAVESSGGGTSVPPLLALGTSGPDISTSGNGMVTVTSGPVVSDVASGPAVSSVGGKSGVSASGGIYSAGGTCSPVACSTVPPYPDPYAALPDPVTGGVITAPAAVTVPGDVTISASGDSSRRMCPTLVTVAGVATCTIAPGVYVIGGSLTISGNIAVVGSNVLFVFPKSTTTASTSLSVSGGVVVNLTGLNTSAAGPYQGFLIYQPGVNNAGGAAASNALPLSLSGGAVTAGGCQYGGRVYAPAATVTLGGSAGLTMSSITAGAVFVSGSGKSFSVTVGC